MTIECLESRIAPATLSADFRSVTWTDIDGDLAKLTVSQGTLQLTDADGNPGDNLIFTPPDGNSRQTLQLVDLAFQGAEFTGVNITLSAQEKPGGDGLANVGRINGTAVDLGSVVLDGDLGRIAAGNADTASGIELLKAQSIGRFSVTTQQAGGNLTSNIVGAIGKLQVRGDIVDARISVTGGDDGRIGQLVLGGSLIGGGANQSGFISTTGSVGTLTIRGSIFGGDGDASGHIRVGTTIGTVALGGSIVGGTGGIDGDITAASGVLLSGAELNKSGNIGPITIAGSLVGGDGPLSGTLSAGDSVDVGAAIASLKVGGIIGGFGDSSGSIGVLGTLGKLTVKGSIRGEGEDSASVRVFGDLGSATITGSIEGGAGADSASLLAFSNIGPITLGGSLKGGTGDGSASISAGNNLGPITIKGSMFISGTGGESGEIFAGKRIASLSVLGSIIGLDPTVIGGSNITAGEDIGSIKVGGSILGGDRSIRIFAGGQATPGLLDLAIGRIVVKGTMENTNIIVGNNNPSDASDDNGDASIGSILIGGDFVGSNILLGVDDGPDNDFATNDDSFIGLGQAAKFSTLGSLTIRGQALGSVTLPTVNHFIMAERTGPVSVNGVNIAVPTNDTVFIGASGDLFLRTAG